MESATEGLLVDWSKCVLGEELLCVSVPYCQVNTYSCVFAIFVCQVCQVDDMYVDCRHVPGVSSWRLKTVPGAEHSRN